jgi:hypothetical protein
MTTKTLKDLFEVYKPKSPDEQKFVDKHVTIKHKDRNGNDDDVFKGNTKYIKRKEERKGYDVGDDEKVYEETDVEESYAAASKKAEASRQRAIKSAAKAYKNHGDMDRAIKDHDLFAKDAAKIKAHLGEEVEDLEELSHDTLRRYRMKSKSIGDNEKGDINYRAKGRELAGRKTYGGRMAGIEKAKVMATNEEVETLEEGMMKLSKVHIVHHHDHPAAKEFAKHYTTAMKGDHRESGPNEADEKAANAFHQRYTGVRTREGFAGSGTHIYTDHKTGAKWKVDRHPNGKTFYGTDHIISHHTGPIHESLDLEEGEVLDTVAEDRVLRSLVAYYEELGEEVLIDDVIAIAEEMIDELSKGTLASYAGRAMNDVRNANQARIRWQNKPKDSFTGAHPKTGETVTKSSKEMEDEHARVAKNREKGVRTAIKKLAKEEVEEIEELSKKTLGNYSYKAATDLGQRGITAGVKVADNKSTKDDFKKMGNRQKGVAMAVKKLTKEDVINITIEKLAPVLEDVEPLTPEERLVSKLDGLSEGHIHLLLSLFESLNEDNQTKMLSAVDTKEGIDGLIDFAIENRGE